MTEHNLQPTCNKLATDTISSHSEKQILEGCISLMQEMVDGFREYLDYIGHDEPEYEEEKQPFHMSYFHIVNRLFLWHTYHSGGTSTRAKCHELGIDDSSQDVEFYLWEEEEAKDDQRRSNQNFVSKAELHETPSQWHRC